MERGCSVTDGAYLLTHPLPEDGPNELVSFGVSEPDYPGLGIDRHQSPADALRARLEDSGVQQSRHGGKMSEMHPLSEQGVHSASAKSVTTVWLPPEVTALTTARRMAREAAARVREELVDAIELVVSELVTNAVKHAGLRPDDRIQLVAERSHDQIRIEVWDAGAGFEPPDEPDPSPLMKPSGWGLYLVDRLSDRWGASREVGTRVWSEFDL